MGIEVTKEYRTLKTQVRLLSLYALLLTVLGVWWAFRTGGDVHVKTLSAEQVSIVEPDGTVKLDLFNKEHLPVAVVNGMKLPRNGGGESGLMFYNEEGEECGGLIYSGRAGSEAGMSLTMDRYRQDQEVQLEHEQDTVDGQPVTSNLLVINDRPDMPLDQAFRRVDSLRDPVARRQAIQRLSGEGFFGRNRVRLGRKITKDVGLFLCDDQGRPRLEVLVDKGNQPHIRLLDETGKVTAELPNSPAVR